MHHSSVGTDARSVDLLGILGEFADPDRREETAVELARLLGGENLVLFAPDPELGVLLPAPGFSQVLRSAAAWHEFLEACTRDGDCSGQVPGADGVLVPARGCAAPDGTTAVLLGTTGDVHRWELLLPLLPLLGSLFRVERKVAADDARVRSADEALKRAHLLTRTLQQMRERLEGALVETEEARKAAKERAEHAESLAAQLRAKAEQLQQQAVELEVLNDQLAKRTNEAERARAAADAANVAKSDFLATMSHELRTPLNAMIGYADLLLAGVPEPIPEQAKKQVERIGISSRHLLELIEEILTFSRMEAGEERVELEDVELGAVLTEVEALIAPLALGKGIHFECRAPEPPGCIRSDARKIRQMLVNLLGNAVKFTRQGYVALHMERDGKDVVFQVIDSGPGIAPEHLEQVFEAFWQVEGGPTRTAGGTGLGLSVTRRLARLLGGEVTAESEVGRGSTFTVRIPADRPAQADS